MNLIDYYISVFNLIDVLALQVKFRKTYDDVGSSCEKTENGVSPVKNKINNIKCSITPEIISAPDDKRINSNFDENLDNISEKNEDSVVNVDSTCVESTEKLNNKKLNVNCSNNDGDKILPNLSFSIVDSIDKNDKKIINTNNLDDKYLQVPGKFFHNLQHSSERLLSPLPSKYEVTEISEEFISSRSDSPIDKRFLKNNSNIFRRESRFRSIKNNNRNNYESGKMTAKDKKLLKMILVIFSSFLICYLPITITKTFRDKIDLRGLNIAGYILIYLTTCINPVIYVVMSSEYRSAYKNVLLCRSETIIGDVKKRGK